MKIDLESRSVPIGNANGQVWLSDPFTAPGTLVNIIKTKTSRYARTQYGDTILKESCQDSLFWSNSYFTTIANENSLQLIQEYINNQ